MEVLQLLVWYMGININNPHFDVSFDGQVFIFCSLYFISILT